MRWPWNSKKKEHPRFWEDYVAAFAKATPKKKSWADRRFVVFDTETTGLDPMTARILSIGAVAINGNEIRVDDSLELYIQQDHYNPESAPIHGILKKGSYEKVNEVAAIQQCLEYIGTDILVAHHASFDRAMVNAALKRYGLGKLKNQFLDTGHLYKKLEHPVHAGLVDKHYTLEALAEALKIPLSDRHTAAGDAFITAMAFIKIVNKLDQKGKKKIEKLFY